MRTVLCKGRGATPSRHKSPRRKPGDQAGQEIPSLALRAFMGHRWSAPPIKTPGASRGIGHRLRAPNKSPRRKPGDVKRAGRDPVACALGFYGVVAPGSAGSAA